MTEGTKKNNETEETKETIRTMVMVIPDLFLVSLVKMILPS